MKIEIEVPDGVYDDVSGALRLYNSKIGARELKDKHSEVVMKIVKRDVEWWLNDCFGEGLADSLDDDDLEALGVPIELNKKEY